MPMRPRMPGTVTVQTPSLPSSDPATGNERQGTLTTVTTRAYLSQQPVTIVSASPELQARQDTTITTYTLLVPASVVLTSASIVTDEDGVRYSVIGQPAERRGLGRSPQFRAAGLHRVSDLQAAS